MGSAANWPVRSSGRRSQPCVASHGGALLPVAPATGGPEMRAFALRLVLLAAFAAPLAVEAETLKVVEVNAPAVNCVFRATCRIPVTDSVGHIPLPYIATAGTAW